MRQLPNLFVPRAEGPWLLGTRSLEMLSLWTWEEGRRFEHRRLALIGVLLRETGRDPKTLGCDYYAGAQEGVADRLRGLTAPVHMSA